MSRLTESQLKIFYMLLSAIAAWIFLPRLWFISIAVFIGRRIGKKNYIKNTEILEKEISEKHFHIFLETMNISMQSGMNFRKALFQSKKKLEKSEEESPFLTAFKKFIAEYQAGTGIQKCFEGLAYETNNKIIMSFANSMVLGVKQGGNIPIMIKTYQNLLYQRKELEEDRKAKLESSKREQYILFSMPLILLSMMKNMGLQPEHIGIIGYITRFFCLGLFYSAWKISKKILNGENNAGYY